ncbi:tetratricopeptide repeat protein [Caldiplasma sukawensis]
MSDNNESNKSLNDYGDLNDHYAFSQTILKLKEWTLSAIETQIQLDPDNPSHYFDKGNILVDLKRYDEAIEAYEKAIKLNEKDPYFHNNLAYSFSKLNRFVEAIKEMEIAIKLNPNDKICRLTYSQIMALIDNEYEGMKSISDAVNNGLINREELLEFVNSELSEDISEKERKLLKKIIKAFS